MARLTQLMDDAENTDMVVFIIVIIHLLFFGIKKFHFSHVCDAVFEFKEKRFDNYGLYLLEF